MPAHAAGNIASQSTSFVKWAKYCYPVLIFVGLISLLAGLRSLLPQFRQRPSSIILNLLFHADLGLLCTSVLWLWVKDQFDNDFRNETVFVCLYTAFINACQQLVSLAILLLTSERIISVFFPTKYKTLCARKRFLFAISILITIAFYFNFPYLPGCKLVPNSGQTDDAVYLQARQSWISFFTGTGLLIERHFDDFICVLVASGVLIIVARIRCLPRSKKFKAVGKIIPRLIASNFTLFGLVAYFSLNRVLINVFWYLHRQTEEQDVKTRYLFSSLAHLVQYSECIMHPAVCFVLSPEMRKSFFQIFCCRRPGNGVVPSAEVTVTQSHKQLTRITIQQSLNNCPASVDPNSNSTRRIPQPAPDIPISTIEIPNQAFQSPFFIRRQVCIRHSRSKHQILSVEPTSLPAVEHQSPITLRPPLTTDPQPCPIEQWFSEEYWPPSRHRSSVCSFNSSHSTLDSRSTFNDLSRSKMCPPYPTYNDSYSTLNDLFSTLFILPTAFHFPH